MEQKEGRNEGEGDSKCLTVVFVKLGNVAGTCDCGSFVFLMNGGKSVGEFNALQYTRDALAEELGLIERHSSDGSAFQAGCACIEEKHLLLVSGLAREGAIMATDEKEKQFYQNLAEEARELRKKIVDGDFGVAGNPRTRGFLPHGLTECEKSHGDVRRELSNCIKEAEIRCCGHTTKHYEECSCNPVAVCRASVPCPS